MENFSLYQLLVPTFAVLMILRALSHTGRGGKTTREFIAIFIFWIFVGLVALFPHIFIDRIAAFLGIRSGINALFFFGFVILFFISFRLLVSVEESEVRITEIIRNIALKDFDETNKQ